MTDLCCIGHITLDEIHTPHSTTYLPGGTSWYFSNAINQLDAIAYRLVTAVAPTEKRFVAQLQAAGIATECLTSTHTLHFVNRYTDDQDHRTQQVKQQADPFTAAQLTGIQARVIHLGPLVADDIPTELIPELATRSCISLDVQGYLRDVQGEEVVPAKWQNARDTLPYLTYLKANGDELEVLTGQTDLYAGARMLAEAGVKEVIVTLGSQGSLIYHRGLFYTIPAYPPVAVVDATGCGDTYMAGYLYQRIKGMDIQEAGEFAAAMASVKIAESGAFTGSEQAVYERMR